MDKGITLTPKKLAVIAVVVVLLIAGGVTVGLNWNNWFGDKAPTSEQGGFTPDIDDNAGAWNGETPEDKTPDAKPGIKIPGYPSITLPADTKDVKVALLNPEDNPCYFTFTIVLKDTGETLYTSKMVPPGQAITNITLSKPLAKGEYNATIQITTAALTNGSAMNGANVETMLIVK